MKNQFGTRPKKLSSETNFNRAPEFFETRNPTRRWPHPNSTERTSENT